MAYCMSIRVFISVSVAIVVEEMFAVPDLLSVRLKDREHSFISNRDLTSIEVELCVCVLTRCFFISVSVSFSTSTQGQI